MRHEIDENGCEPNEEKDEEIPRLKSPERAIELESFFGAIEYVTKFPRKFSERTEN